MVLLVIDDNPADIHLLTLAWSEAEYDKVVPLHACMSCAAALEWIRGLRREESLSAVLTDLMLFDNDGIMAIELLQKIPRLSGVPLVTWSGIDVGRNSTDRITRTGVRMWKKPPNWQSYATFVGRLMDLLVGKSSSSSSRLPTL
jgi:CheY-like chemotaxis protein